ncbi:DUF4386 domain-containing protein [uncultured Eudoraea sp.]|uniref:DUF4386 domain-containing protein n=1 Tax=uncultured Eudoraea sp. TaxID=1035614 RepID=UPI0026335593|nr:DUF4386 domain-containing protein [uncultured Eudoraea sp.]
MSLKKASLFAGIGLLIMTISWLLSDYLVFQKLIEPENEAQTISNIQSNELLFRAGIFGLFIVLLCDLIVAWALYFYFKSISQSISLLVAWFRLVYTVILGIALLNYTDILHLIGQADYLSDLNELATEVMLSIDSFQNDWNFGLIFFGFHLALLGYLFWKSKYKPRIIGLLLMLAGLSYLIDYLGKILSPDFEVTFSLFLGWGELVFMIWLLIKGVKIPKHSDENII